MVFSNCNLRNSAFACKVLNVFNTHAYMPTHFNLLNSSEHNMTKYILSRDFNIGQDRMLSPIILKSKPNVLPYWVKMNPTGVLLAYIERKLQTTTL